MIRFSFFNTNLDSTTFNMPLTFRPRETSIQLKWRCLRSRSDTPLWSLSHPTPNLPLSLSPVSSLSHPPAALNPPPSTRFPSPCCTDASWSVALALPRRTCFSLFFLANSALQYFIFSSTCTWFSQPLRHLDPLRLNQTPSSVRCRALVPICGDPPYKHVRDISHQKAYNANANPTRAPRDTTSRPL